MPDVYGCCPDRWPSCALAETSRIFTPEFGYGVVSSQARPEEAPSKPSQLQEWWVFLTRFPNFVPSPLQRQ